MLKGLRLSNRTVSPSRCLTGFPDVEGIETIRKSPKPIPRLTGFPDVEGIETVMFGVTIHAKPV